MSFKQGLIIGFKLMIIGGLLFYLPDQVNNDVTILNATYNSETSQEVSLSPVSKDKKIHIYNTHQSEQYDGYDVISGAQYLKQCLNDLGYQCDVESNDFENYKAVHNLAYNKSYTVSKLYLQESLKLNGSYDLVIDFHRDSVSKDLSTVSYNGCLYAKIMFVVGKSSGKYDQVNQLSATLSSLANQTVPDISRGVYVKSSHYNQGTTDNMVLIEVGGQSNTKAEVEATVMVLAKIIGEYLG